MIAKLTIGTPSELLTLHLQILQGAFLGGSDDLGSLWKPKSPPIQPKPKHRFPEPHLNTWCRALLEKCAAGGGKPSSFCPHLQQLTHVYAPKHCGPSSQPRDTAAILPFCFHTHTRRQMSKFLFVHQYFYLALKMMISQVAHTQKRDKIERERPWAGLARPYEVFCFLTSFSTSDNSVAKSRSDLNCLMAVSRSMICYWRSQPSSQWTNTCTKIAIT